MLIPSLFVIAACLVLLVVAVRRLSSRGGHPISSSKAEVIIQEALVPFVQQIVGYRHSIVHNTGGVHVDLHLVLPGMMTLRRAQELRLIISDQINHQLGGNSLMVHIESCPLDCFACQKEKNPSENLAGCAYGAPTIP